MLMLLGGDGAEIWVIEVSMTSSTVVTRADWFAIWAAGVEIETMCVQHGFNGTVSHLGKQPSTSLDRLKRRQC